MKRTAFAIALLLGGTAVAQTVEPMDPVTNADMDASLDTTHDATAADHDMATTTSDTELVTKPGYIADKTTLAASGPVVAPSNANPEEDARGISVISDPAVVPSGWNGTTSTGVGGPGDGPDEVYPACTAKVTDNCSQDYEINKG